MDEADELALTIVGDETSFAPGAAVELSIRGASVPTSGEVAPTARVGETDVLLAPVRQDTLAFFVPAIATGRHTLTVQLEGQTAEVPFTVATHEKIEDPAAYVDNQVQAMTARLNEIIEEETDPDARAFLEARLSDAADALEQWDSLSPEEQANVAYALRVIREHAVVAQVNAQLKEAMATGASCGTPASTIIAKTTITAAAITSFVGAGIYTSASTVTGPGVVLGLVAMVASGLALRDLGAELKNLLLKTYNECTSTPQELQLGGGSTSMMARFSTLAFSHGAASPISVETGYTLSDEHLSAVTAALSQLGRIREYIPASWESVFEVPELVWEPGAPDDLTLSSISRDGIEGTIEVSGDEVTLTFSYSEGDDQPLEAQDFTFTLGFGDETAEFGASLEPQDANINIEGLWASTHVTPAVWYLRFSRPSGTSSGEYSFTNYNFNEGEDGEAGCWEVTRWVLDETGANEYAGTLEGEGGDATLTLKFSPGSENTILLEGTDSSGETYQTSIAPAEEPSFDCTFGD